MEVLRKIVDKTKIDRIRSQQIRESCGVHPINEWEERRREWNQYVTRMDAERLILLNIMFYAPMGRFQLELICFALIFHRRSIIHNIQLLD